ncbi:MAG TPA: ATP-binding cassette domain-containing protein [Bacillota bacterium]|jgi:sodium transport system ATP-binding protein
MVEVKGLSKTFKNLTAVAKIDFTAKPGEIFGLLGENGAGKTTTLRLLASILTPTSGDAIVNGFSVVRQPEKVRATIGFVASDAGLYDRLTARENVAYFGRLHGLSRQALEGRIADIFSWLDMNEYADRRVGKFSKGMKQKVCIARALIHDPPVMLLDEPTAGLDVTAIHAVDEFILRAKREGKTIIFSSHIMSEVEKLCDRVAIIHRGAIIASGTMDDLAANRERFEDVFLRLIGGHEQ